MERGRFLLRTDKSPNKFGEYTIVLQYSTQGVPVRTSTGIKVKPEHFLGDTGDSIKFIQGGRGGHPKADLLNRQLQQFKKKYQDVIDDLMMSATNPVMSVEVLRSILNGTYQQEVEKGKGKVGFVELVRTYNRQLYDLGKISYSVWNNIACNMNTFQKFLQKVKHKDLDNSTTLYCTDVSVDLIKEYILWRKEERGNSNETINKALTPIFKTLEHIRKKGWISGDLCAEMCELYLPAHCQSLDDPDDGNVDYLTDKQMNQFVKIRGEVKYPRTRELMDMFLFSFYACGLRISDVCTLKWSDIKWDENMIVHRQVKNHTRKSVVLQIPMNDACREILDRWKGKHNNFVFGLLPDLFNLDDYEKLRRTINSRTKTINTSLQCVGEKMGLPFRLHFHVARHTFAVMALNNGMDIKAISDLMGHSSIMSTEKTYAKYLPDTLKQKVNTLMNFNFTGDVENDGGKEGDGEEGQG